MWDKEKKVDHCREVNNSLTQSTLSSFSPLSSLCSVRKNLFHTTPRYKPSDDSGLECPHPKSLVSRQFSLLRFSFLEWLENNNKSLLHSLRVINLLENNHAAFQKVNSYRMSALASAHQATHTPFETTMC